MGILDAIKLGKEKEVAHAKTVRKLSGLEQAIKQRPPPREFVGRSPSAQAMEPWR